MCHFLPPIGVSTPLETELTRVAFLKVHKPLILWLGVFVAVCVASFLIARY